MTLPTMKVLGDSTTRGVDGGKVQQYGTVELVANPWPSYITGWTVTNSGVDGAWAESMIVDLPAKIAGFDAALLQSGVNDPKHTATQTPAQFVANVNTFIDTCLAAGVRPILATSFLCDDTTTNNPAEVDARAADMRVIAAARGVWLVDVWQMCMNWIIASGYACRIVDLMVDHTHPSAWAYSNFGPMANNALNNFRAAVKIKSTRTGSRGVASYTRGGVARLSLTGGTPTYTEDGLFPVAAPSGRDGTYAFNLNDADDARMWAMALGGSSVTIKGSGVLSGQSELVEGIEA